MIPAWGANYSCENSAWSGRHPSRENSAMTMILRGRKLQEALQLVAEGQLSDFQIAERLNVSPRILKATRELPFFEKRVAEIRQVLQQNPGGATRENPVY